MSFGNHDIIIVTPIYEDTDASSQLFNQLNAEFRNRINVVAVDEGSIKEPLAAKNLEEANLEGVVLTLKRNVGHQKAIAIGLSYVSQYMREHQRIVVMDSDGEDLPSNINDLLEALEVAQCNGLVAQRKSRIETLKFKVFYSVYKRFFKYATGRSISFGNFMALKPFAVRRLVVLQELSLHVAGTIIASKLRYHRCPIARGPRFAGQSKMNFVGLVLHGFKGLMVLPKTY